MRSRLEVVSPDHLHVQWLLQKLPCMMSFVSRGRVVIENRDLYPQAKPICALQEDFWSNVGRYGSYFFSVLLGTAYTAVKPIGGWLKKPVSAVLTITAIIGLYIFVSSTVTAMLGVNNEDALVLPPLFLK